MSRVVCVGEAFVDLLAESEIADVGASESFQRAAGGAVANVAIGVARLGGSVAFVGTVGKDPFGAFLLRTLAHEHVVVDGVRSVDDQTSVVLVSRGPGGARDFFPLNSPGAEARLAPEDLDRELLAKARCVHFGGVVLAAQPGRSACMAAAGYGTGLVSFDLNVRPRIFDDAAQMRRVIADGCAAAHLVKCSHEDLAALSIDTREPAALLGGKTGAAIVTLGAQGCRWATSDGARGDAVAPQVPVVDTTGAGDAFMAAVLWRLCFHHQGRIDGGAVADAAGWAVVAGALACQKTGAIASLPRSDELEAAMRTVR